MFPCTHPYASTALPASIVAGALDNSSNSAQSPTWSLTLFPWNTTLPLNLRSGWPLGNSEPFSTRMPNTLPTCTVFLLALASWLTSFHSLTLSISQAVCFSNLSHSLSIAFMASGVIAASFFDTERATQICMKRCSTSGIFVRCLSLDEQTQMVGIAGTDASNNNKSLSLDAVVSVEKGAMVPLSFGKPNPVCLKFSIAMALDFCENDCHTTPGISGGLCEPFFLRVNMP